MYINFSNGSQQSSQKIKKNHLNLVLYQIKMFYSLKKKRKTGQKCAVSQCIKKRHEMTLVRLLRLSFTAIYTLLYYK